MEGIAARGITKRFGVVTALAGIDLDVGPGEAVALLGPNGAGKSTLLRILGTTVLPDTGHATVAGHDLVAEPSAVRRRIGVMLGDERSWYWRLTGRHNLEFFAALHGLRRKQAAGRAGQLLAEMGLADAADRRFDGYSSGMRARLSLARALLADPPVLLLDEPTRSLDPVAAVGFRDRVARLVEEGTAVLFATHDLHEAAALGSKVVLMVAGRVAAVEEGGADAAALERTMLAATTS